MDPESCVADQGFAVRRDGDERRGCQRQLVSVRHCDPCSRISPIPTWEAATGPVAGAHGRDWRRLVISAAASSCIGDAPSPIHSLLNPGRFSNLRCTPVLVSPLAPTFRPSRSLCFCLFNFIRPVSTRHQFASKANTVGFYVTAGARTPTCVPDPTSSKTSTSTRRTDSLEERAAPELCEGKSGHL
jgi:hypothetical protein